MSWRFWAACWVSQFPHGPIPALDWLGRHPLTSYLVQYYIIFAIAYALAVLR